MTTSALNVDIKVTLRPPPAGPRGPPPPGAPDDAGVQTRRFSLPVDFPGWNKLATLIKERFQLPEFFPIGLRYKDNDGEDVTISSDEELKAVWPEVSDDDMRDLDAIPPLRFDIVPLHPPHGPRHGRRGRHGDEDMPFPPPPRGGEGRFPPGPPLPGPPQGRPAPPEFNDAFHKDIKAFIDIVKTKVSDDKEVQDAFKKVIAHAHPKHKPDGPGNKKPSDGDKEKDGYTVDACIEKTNLLSLAASAAAESGPIDGLHGGIVAAILTPAFLGPPPPPPPHHGAPPPPPHHDGPPRGPPGRGRRGRGPPPGDFPPAPPHGDFPPPPPPHHEGHPFGFPFHGRHRGGPGGFPHPGPPPHGPLGGGFHHGPMPPFHEHPFGGRRGFGGRHDFGFEDRPGCGRPGFGGRGEPGYDFHGGFPFDPRGPPPFHFGRHESVRPGRFEELSDSDESMTEDSGSDISSDSSDEEIPFRGGRYHSRHGRGHFRFHPHEHRGGRPDEGRRRPHPPEGPSHDRHGRDDRPRHRRDPPPPPHRHGRGPSRGPERRA